MEERNSVTIHESDQVGEVRIADEVVAIIAGLAANEVEGVEHLGGSSMTGRKGKKNLAKGITIDIADNEIICDIDVHLDYGVKIPQVANDIQQKVKSAVENMTGLHVKEVNLHVLGIKMNKTN
ncbi:Asp23/Gls24 family envelope stress response protein [Vallitalea okinawensis]|uniref:Asp23/Gls24 family envelope stress response protein n=1 Tax=Vallitalea okinawensis TaxID=2078660 RepID=UPI001FA855DE|nr:Asp23/Gls24 family envelope stress response protein [Vallitalea okinawensis]